ncbi:MAG: hypothetical protein WCK91_00020 [bacterium]
MKIKKYLVAGLTSATILGSLVAMPVLAEESSAGVAPAGQVLRFKGGEDQGRSQGGDQGKPNPMMPGGQPGMMGRANNKKMGRPAILGTVTAISGNTITITRTNPMMRLNKSGEGDNSNTNTASPSTAPATSTTLTIDATNAKVAKAGVLATLADIVVGDTVMITGELKGTTIVAKVINDGPLANMMGDLGQGKGRGGKEGKGNGDGQEAGPNGTSPFTGSGQPVVAGSITSITGNSVVITNKGNVTYTVDVTSAKILAGDKAGTVADLKVGDMIIVQGAISGTSVTATTVLDGKPKMENVNTNTNVSGGEGDQGGQGQMGQGDNQDGGAPKPQQKPKGFFGSVGGFFGRIFGF